MLITRGKGRAYPGIGNEGGRVMSDVAMGDV